MQDRKTLEEIIARLENGNAEVEELWQSLGLTDVAGFEVDEPELYEPREDWPEETCATFRYALGNYGLYRNSDAYLSLAVDSFVEAFEHFVEQDTSRAARCCARMLRASAYASVSLPQVLEHEEMIDFIRGGACPPSDAEELDLSTADACSRMAIEGAFNDAASLTIAITELVKPALLRLLANPPKTMQSRVYAKVGLWLAVDELWPDDELAPVVKALGVQGRAQLRRAAYERALESEQGEFFVVGSSIDAAQRKRAEIERHLGNLVEICEELGDRDGAAAARKRWA